MASRVFNGGDYADSGNWSGGVRPSTGDTVVQTAVGTCNTDESAVVLAGLTMNANINLTMSQQTSSSGTIHLVNGATAAEIHDATLPAWVNSSTVLTVDSIDYAIASRTDDTHFELAVAWAPGSMEGVPYLLTLRGHIKSLDGPFYMQAGAGLIIFDNGIITHGTTGATVYLMTVRGIETTVNGGTLNLPSAQAEKTSLTIPTQAEVSGYSAAVRLHIYGGGGASAPVIAFGYRALLKWCDVESCMRLLASYVVGARVQGCLVHDWPAAGGGFYSTALGYVRDSWIYNGGVASTYNALAARGQVYCTNVVFGKTEAGVPSMNGYDIQSVGATDGRIILRNCELASTNQVSIHANSNVDVISTSHGRVPGAFKAWLGRGHTVEKVAGGQAGNCLKLDTSSVASDIEPNQLIHCLALIPAFDADTIDITVYVKGTTGKTCVLWIDKDGLFGTPQYKSVAGSTGSWVKETIPTFTVSTGGSEKVLVPVDIIVARPNETWYADSLNAVTVGAGANQSIDFEHSFDGVHVAAGAAGGVIVIED